jgi:hypothetical protein
MHGKQDSSEKSISFFQPLFDRELNGESDDCVPVLAELQSPENQKKTSLQKLDSPVCCGRFRASRQSFLDSALKTASEHVTSRVVGQKINFYENPKLKGLQLANRFSKSIGSFKN